MIARTCMSQLLERRVHQSRRRRKNSREDGDLKLIPSIPGLDDRSTALDADDRFRSKAWRANWDTFLGSAQEHLPVAWGARAEISSFWPNLFDLLQQRW